ncbi:hypothetical protein GALMADRAFT_1074706 [Galerina marginata CBS 339.88]|uniref:Uncharacterized protein n=1 Tax=Galerina marginata (strain CBS 339.88) TaxID=685588 RepID=A0A067SCK4_GALM3|nr:hypothetical protein GALMADRAFT_1074706 [Galerina marginata CBS 339.88]
MAAALGSPKAVQLSRRRLTLSALITPLQTSSMYLVCRKYIAFRFTKRCPDVYPPNTLNNSTSHNRMAKWQDTSNHGFRSKHQQASCRM